MTFQETTQTGNKSDLSTTFRAADLLNRIQFDLKEDKEEINKLQEEINEVDRDLLTLGLSTDPSSVGALFILENVMTLRNMLGQYMNPPRVL